MAYTTKVVIMTGDSGPVVQVSVDDVQYQEKEVVDAAATAAKAFVEACEILTAGADKIMKSKPSEKLTGEKRRKPTEGDAKGMGS